MKHLVKNINKFYAFYFDGFKQMSVGRKLWKIIFIKLFIMFVILKLFFFPNYLNTTFTSDEERANHVLEIMTQNTNMPNKNLENKNLENNIIKNRQ